ncbi:hypothetical protein [Leptospira levettii]|uniref:hypothetical protein n=1 Tax=Leptospira levettii TaxID=2023178 RepID=UPI000C296A00|nr:hypothetical protein [Leptospira levettii]PJZ87348.1 hypothetical protein CH368_17285 [Leptospira levettii]
MSLQIKCFRCGDVISYGSGHGRNLEFEKEHWAIGPVEIVNGIPVVKNNLGHICLECVQKAFPKLFKLNEVSPQSIIGKTDLGNLLEEIIESRGPLPIQFNRLDKVVNGNEEVLINWGYDGLLHTFEVNLSKRLTLDKNAMSIINSCQSPGFALRDSMDAQNIGLFLTLLRSPFGEMQKAKIPTEQVSYRQVELEIRNNPDLALTLIPRIEKTERGLRLILNHNMILTENQMKYIFSLLTKTIESAPTIEEANLPECIRKIREYVYKLVREEEIGFKGKYQNSSVSEIVAKMDQELAEARW